MIRGEAVEAARRYCQQQVERRSGRPSPGPPPSTPSTRLLAGELPKGFRRAAASSKPRATATRVSRSGDSSIPRCPPVECCLYSAALPMPETACTLLLGPGLTGCRLMNASFQPSQTTLCSSDDSPPSPPLPLHGKLPQTGAQNPSFPVIIEAPRFVRVQEVASKITRMRRRP